MVVLEYVKMDYWKLGSISTCTSKSVQVLQQRYLYSWVLTMRLKGQQEAFAMLLI